MCGSGRSGICHGAYIVRPWLWRCIACDVRNAGFGWKRSSNCRPSAVQQAIRRDRGEACESAAASQVARRFHLPETTVRAIDLRYLERWNQHRRKPALKQMGVDEIYRGKNDKFLTVVSNLETGEPLWFGRSGRRRRWTSTSGRNSEAGSANASRPPVWTCGSPSGSVLRSGLRSAALYTTSSTSSSTPTTRWTRCGGQSSSAKGEDARCSSKGRSGCC